MLSLETRLHINNAEVTATVIEGEAEASEAALGAEPARLEHGDSEEVDGADGPGASDEGHVSAGGAVGVGALGVLAGWQNTTTPIGACEDGGSGLVVAKPTGPGGLPLPRNDNSVTWAITDDNPGIEEGVRELEAATGLDPNLGYAYLQLAFLYAILGDFERAEAAARRAVELEDRNASGTLGLRMVGSRARLGYVHYRTGRYEEALALYLVERETLAGGAHALRDRALIEIDQKIGAACLALGRAEEAEAALTRALEAARELAEWRRLDPATAYYVACAYALRGETAPALEALARAVDHNPAIAKRRALEDPDLASLSAEPEFRRLTAPDGDAFVTNIG